MAKKTFKEHNKLKQILKKRKVPIVTEGMRKKYGVCEHDNVNYKALEKLNKSLLLHCKRLSRDIDRKGKMMELWMNNRQLWTNKINKDYVKRVYDTLDKRLEENEFLGVEYSIADIATWPWIARFEIHQTNLKKYNNILRWYKIIAKRTAVIKGYHLGKEDKEIPQP